MKKIEKKAAWAIQSAGETTENNLAEYEYSQKGRRLVENEIYLSFVHHHKDDFRLFYAMGSAAKGWLTLQGFR